jgi:hypothetical protein
MNGRFTLMTNAVHVDSLSDKHIHCEFSLSFNYPLTAHEQLSVSRKNVTDLSRPCVDSQERTILTLFAELLLVESLAMILVDFTAPTKCLLQTGKRKSAFIP